MAADRPDRAPASHVRRRLALLVAVLASALLFAAPPPGADGSSEAERGQALAEQLESGPGGPWVVAGSTGDGAQPWGLVGKAGGGPPGMMGGEDGWTGYGPMMDDDGEDDEGVSTLGAIGLFAGGALLGGLLVLGGVMLGRRRG